MHTDHIKIIILKPEMFATTIDGTMGLVLFRNAFLSWFFDGEYVPSPFNSNELSEPSNDEILEELQDNVMLLELALQHDAIEVQDRDDVDYLNYCLSYD